MRTSRHLRDWLAETFPAWQVTDDSRDVTVTRPTIVMLPATIRRLDMAGKQLAVAVDIELWLQTEKTAPRDIEAALDTNMLKLLAALEGEPRFTWTEARRGALETGHGWNMTITQVLQLSPL